MRIEDSTLEMKLYAVKEMIDHLKSIVESIEKDINASE
jgi:hypothetical protein